MVDVGDLHAFAEKVSRLRAEGLTTQDVARRLGIPPATLYERMRKASR
jgi:AcrR family transcriptional regulator